jgi:hypothetical protein
MTTPPPMSPRAFTSSLNARAANASKATGIPTRELLERYFHQRLLARVFHADDAGWVLKGGQALLVRWPKARYSTDVDLLRTGEDSTIDEAVTALIEVVSTKPGRSSAVRAPRHVPRVGGEPTVSQGPLQGHVRPAAAVHG